MAEFSLPPGIIQEGVDLPTRMSMEEMFRFVAQQIETTRLKILQDPRMSNERVAHRLMCMAHEIIIDDAVPPTDGDVLYAYAGGRRAAWGSAGAPAPTDPGSGPAGGVTDGDKGDITVSVGGTVWNIDANAVGTTEIADSAVTAAKIANRTRKTWVLAAEWNNLTGTVAVTNSRGADAAGDRVPVLSYTSAGDSVATATVGIPADYDSGSLEFFLLWSADSGAGDTQGFYMDFSAKSLVPGADALGATPTAIAADQILPTTNPLDVNYYRTSLGTLSTDVAAGRVVAMQLKRDVTAEIAAGGLATAQNLAVVGIEIAYTADS